MTFLVAYTNVERLRALALMLKSIAPQSSIISEKDPLMAAKRAFQSPVDALVTELNMKRMNGAQLCGFVLEKNPRARVCIIADQAEYDECLDIPEGDVRRLALPVTEEALREALLT